MMNCRISIHKSSEEIPQVINGMSANTIFYLINYQSLQNIECFGNTSIPSLPSDLDDFGRCALACKAFNWTNEDFKKAESTAKALNYNESFINFLSKFAFVYKVFKTGNKQIVEDFLEELKGE